MTSGETKPKKPFLFEKRPLISMFEEMGESTEFFVTAKL
jgi:hypothetical protein